MGLRIVAGVSGSHVGILLSGHEIGKTREGETKISLPALSNLGCLIR